MVLIDRALAAKLRFLSNPMDPLPPPPPPTGPELVKQQLDAFRQIMKNRRGSKSKSRKKKR